MNQRFIARITFPVLRSFGLSGVLLMNRVDFGREVGYMAAECGPLDYSLMFFHSGIRRATAWNSLKCLYDGVVHDGF